MPQFYGRLGHEPSGTRIDLQIVPNIALLICLLVVFAFMGILVYDKNWVRVVIATSGNILLAALLLFVSFLVSVDSAKQKLKQVLNASVYPADHKYSSRGATITLRRVASWMLAATIFVAGTVLWMAVHSGRLSLSMRPAIDVVIISWTTIGLLVLWLFTLADFSPVTRVRCLLVVFAVMIAWSWTTTVDGYGGDGRPMFVWRNQAREDSGDVSNEVGHVADSPSNQIDLRPAGRDDLPAFRGRHRDGVVGGAPIDPDWERHPPRIAWQQPIGVGWSSYAIAGGYAVTQEQRGDDEAVVCYEMRTGRQCWEHRNRARFHEMMGGDGPRATPTLDEGDVYALGATGILNRLRGQDGEAVWSVNIIDDAKAPASLFGMTGSPLIWNDLVIVNPGGPQASLVAYDKRSGERRWSAGNAPTAYASPQAVRLGGHDQVLTFNAEGLFAHSFDDGEILWSYPWVTPPEFNNVCQPVVWRHESGSETVFVSSGYGKGCALLKIDVVAGGFSARPLWQNKNMKVKFSSVVARDGYVYGLDENILACIDLRTGERCWKGGRYGFGQLLLTGTTLLILSDDGEVILCEATPKQHRELARLPVLNARTWNHPALSGNTLLVRNDRSAACVILPTLGSSQR